MLDNKTNPETEIHCRARSAFLRMKSLLTNPTLSLNIRYRFVKTYIYSILSYGTETWTLGTRLKRRSETFKMWVMHRMLKIWRIKYIANKTTLRKMIEDRETFGRIKKRMTRQRS